ncbi:MAG TPA: helix-turn-helix domain-containing protein [Streptosporangiaceae bacterium]|nr:helix-turn-helix domain-containing protein [Streptosporangiaceae bacterium]
MSAESADGGTVTPFAYWMVTFDGTLLRKRRRERGLSQERLAYRSRVSLGTIGRVEKLTAASCHISTLHCLASALSPDPDALISELTGCSGDATARRGLLPSPRSEQWWREAKPFPAGRTEHGRYDAAMARELLAMTGEFPNTKGGLLRLLTEYRHALYDIATESTPG